MTGPEVAYQALVDREAARIRDRLDEHHRDTLAMILHTDANLADVVRLTIGAVILDLHETLAAERLEDLGPCLTAWGQIAEPGWAAQ